MSNKRKLAGTFLTIGGVSQIVYGISHIFLPSFLEWDTHVTDIPIIIQGVEVSNKVFLYLSNSAVTFIYVGIGIISLFCISNIKKGKRWTAMFCICWSIYLLFRAILQLYYFELSSLNLLVLSSVLFLLIFYSFPLFCLKEFTE